LRNAHKQYARHRVHKLLMYDHKHTGSLKTECLPQQITGKGTNLSI